MSSPALGDIYAVIDELGALTPLNPDEIEQAKAAVARSVCQIIAAKKNSAVDAVVAMPEKTRLSNRAIRKAIVNAV